MDRVVITKMMIGICGMSVCAVKDATDEEILQVCNLQNPSGTTNGWSEVIRHVEEKPEDEFQIFGKNCAPVVCADDPERLHFLVSC